MHSCADVNLPLHAAIIEEDERRGVYVRKNLNNLQKQKNAVFFRRGLAETERHFIGQC